VISTS